MTARLAIVPSLVLALILGAAGVAHAQPTEIPLELRARAAMDRGEYLVAIPLLLEALKLRPSANTSLDLGIAYRHNRDWQESINTLKNGAARYPQDPRVPAELANAYLDAGDTNAARQALHDAIRMDPANAAAAELLASVELSEGEIQAALRVWNQSGRPIVNNVLQNANIAFSSWTVQRANAFHHGKMMTYAQWRTTELRLLETGVFSNVGLDIEPAPEANRYNPIILTSDKPNDLASIAFGLVKGAPLETSYFNWWNVAKSGMTLNSKYRWNSNRRRGELQLHAPLPAPGILFLSATGLWRSERWDLSHELRTDAGPNDRFHYKSTGVRLEFKYVPHYRFAFGAGFEYTNRAANGGLPQLFTDGRDSGKLLFQGDLRLADGYYKNRFHAGGFVARKSLLGDLNYSASTIEMDNRFLISKSSDTVLHWTIKGGTSRGQLPVEEYFVLSIDTDAGNPLRAHPAARQGHYGNAPMGTSFALSNIDIDRRIAVLPLFNTLGIPYLNLKVMAFIDSGKTFDRARIFRQGTLYVDTGGGLKFETPTHSFNLIYGRNLRDGNHSRNVLFAYIEKRW